MFSRALRAEFIAFSPTQLILQDRRSNAAILSASRLQTESVPCSSHGINSGAHNRLVLLPRGLLRTKPHIIVDVIGN
jgi:hypothetical protein